MILHALPGSPMLNHCLSLVNLVLEHPLILVKHTLEWVMTPCCNVKSCLEVFAYIVCRELPLTTRSLLLIFILFCNQNLRVLCN